MAPPPQADQMAGGAAGGAARPDQFERREQLPALLAPQDAARDDLPRHCRGIQPVAAEAAGDPQSFAQLADLRHAVHGHPYHAAEHVRYRDLAELGKDGGDAALNDGSKTAGPRLPGGFRAGPHQPVAVDDPEMIDAVTVGYRPLEGNHRAQPLAERLRDRGIAPDRQQR